MTSILYQVNIFCLFALFFWIDINTLLLCSLNDLAPCMLGIIGLSTGECDKYHS